MVEKSKITNKMNEQQNIVISRKEAECLIQALDFISEEFMDSSLDIGIEVANWTTWDSIKEKIEAQLNEITLKYLIDKILFENVGDYNKYVITINGEEVFVESRCGRTILRLMTEARLPDFKRTKRAYDINDIKIIKRLNGYENYFECQEKGNFPGPTFKLRIMQNTTMGDI